MSGSRTVPACPPTPETGWLANYYSILLLGWMVEELPGQGFSHCPSRPPRPGTGWLADYYSILLLGWLVEELSGERFSYCPGLPAYTGDCVAS